jgi:hypothetical protein
MVLGCLPQKNNTAMLARHMPGNNQASRQNCLFPPHKHHLLSMRELAIIGSTISGPGHHHHHNHHISSTTY